MFKRKTGDQALVKRLLAGQESAFNEFFDSFFPRLYRFALARLGNDAQIAEDVVQATFCAVIDKLETYRGEAALFSWICTFCRHEISAYFRANRRFQAETALVEDSPEIRAALESLAGEADDQLETVRRKEVARLVQVALDHLTPKYSQVLRWKYMQGRSVDQIAHDLNLGVKAAESLLTRARLAFRDGFSSLVEGVPHGRY